jgi:GDP-L-fucose synthase
MNQNIFCSKCHRIPSQCCCRLIRKAQENDVLEVFGDGSQIRDFIFADDVANGMIHAVKNKITQPINLGSGKGFTIKEIVDIVVKYSGRDIEVKWLTDAPAGDKIRLFDTTRAKLYGFEATIGLEEGIGNTTNWFINNKETLDKRYNAFVNG